jgi:hypothetical protein
MPWILALWLLAAVSSAVLAGTEAARRLRWGTSMIVLAALMLAGSAAAALHGFSLRAASPMIADLGQDALPIFSCLLGGWAAASWFVARRLVGTGPLGPLASILAVIIASAIEGPGGSLVDAGALAALLLACALSRRLAATRLRRLMLAAGLVLLWAGGFLLYLSIIPAQVTAESGGRAASAFAPTEMLLWAVPAALLPALLFGFFKPHRG